MTNFLLKDIWSMSKQVIGWGRKSADYAGKDPSGLREIQIDDDFLKIRFLIFIYPIIYSNELFH